MGKRSFYLLIITVLTGFLANGQDTLPNFSATTRGNNRVVISWTNNYKFVSQISIQRSTDSTKNFKTILTVPDPIVPQNGFVDSKAPANNLFYRLFIVLDSGRYVFTKSKRAFWDTAVVKKSTEDLNNMPVNGSQRVIVSKELDNRETKELKEKIVEANKPDNSTPVVEPDKFFVVIKRDSLIGSINQKNYKQFRDSVVTKTKDTILFKTVDTIQIRPFVPKVVYKPSKYIYTEKDGNVAIALPDAASKKYLVKFYEDNNDFLFEVRKVKENFMYLDKANFQHSGWFRFELLEDGKLVEKHRFYIPKEF
ncbi:MAG: hypothetical protein ACXWV5_05060 [Flavitalea sp.]